MRLPFVVEASSFSETLAKSDFSHPVEYCVANARGKALEVGSRMSSAEATVVLGSDTIVTVSIPLSDDDEGHNADASSACVGGSRIGEWVVLEKPTTEEDARRTLRLLRDGPDHFVVSSVTLTLCGDWERGDAETRVMASRDVLGGTDGSATMKPGVVYSCVSDEGGVMSVTFAEATRVVFDGSVADEALDAYVLSGEPMDKAGSYGIQGLGGSLVRMIEGDYFSVMGLPMSSLARALRPILQ
jgi:predicted house-cleaning NTP pyrophosphatase (Maf/HAM1 superfamily)